MAAAATERSGTGPRPYKQPYFLHPADHKLIYFAGLMSASRTGDEGLELSCAILTRAATGTALEIHPRMPVVLNDEDLERWVMLSVSAPEDVAQMIERARDEFQYHPVSSRVNTTKADEASLMAPLH